LVPRHPERFEAVFKLCESSGYITQRRSANQAFTYDCDIILGDSIGEIAYWYTSADAIFIGGSLVETGGHNPLEAIIYGIPVVSGPAIFNFNDVYGVLYEEQLAWITNDEEALVSKLQQLLGLTRYERSMLKSRAEKALAYHRGAVYKILKLCNDLIARQLV